MFEVDCSYVNKMLALIKASTVFCVFHPAGTCWCWPKVQGYLVGLLLRAGHITVAEPKTKHVVLKFGTRCIDAHLRIGTSARGTTPAGATVPVPAFAGDRAPVNATTEGIDNIAALLDSCSRVVVLPSLSCARHCKERHCMVCACSVDF